mgnify:CR=1 FL=1
MRKSKEYFRGCLIGGAIGDALGWPVEFLTYSEILKKYGMRGIVDLDIAFGGKAEITDDTQMTIFTAEGLLRAKTRSHDKGICHIASVIYHAYLRWLHTQGLQASVKYSKDGWVLGIKDLHQRRGPGNTCISALASGTMGTIREPINNSKGCGGVMRMAPVGLMLEKHQAFEIGCEAAAITHGHPSGYLSAGMLAYIISAMIEGLDLRDAVLAAMEEVKRYPDHQECLLAVQRAVDLADEGNPSVQAVSQLGEGWVGEEALAIAIYCSLVYKDDFRKALCLSVNHDGDSDSTGAITGNILGTYLGIEKIPEEWINKVELKDELIVLADDLLAGFEDSDTWRKKYPGW